MNYAIDIRFVPDSGRGIYRAIIHQDGKLRECIEAVSLSDVLRELARCYGDL